MIPPTPTPIPTGIVDLPTLDVPSLWTMAPEAVQVWNSFGSITELLQVLLLLLLAGFLLFVFYRFWRRFMNERAGSGEEMQ